MILHCTQIPLKLFSYAVYCISLISIASCTTHYPNRHFAENHSVSLPRTERIVSTSRPEPKANIATQGKNSEVQSIEPSMDSVHPQMRPVESEQSPASRVNISELNEALFRASELGDMPTLLRMIEQGANVASANTSGETALHSAAAHNQLDAARVLIENGADVNSTTSSNWTPLHSAARFGALEVISLLLESGSMSELRNNDGKSALDLAQQVGNHAAARLLTSN